MGRFWRCFFACGETKENNDTRVGAGGERMHAQQQQPRRDGQQDRRAQRKAASGDSSGTRTRIFFTLNVLLDG
jgi:hypothetical protein